MADTPPQSVGGPSPTSQVSAAASTLVGTSGPSRKQNVACDACRARKVKCHQVSGQDKCTHCMQKNFDCTHLIQQATSEKRRVVGNRRTKVSTEFPIRPSSQNALAAASRVPAPLQPDVPLSTFQPHADLPYGTTRQRTNTTLQLIDWLFSPPEDVMMVPPFVGGPDSVGYRNFIIQTRTPVSHAVDADWGDLKRHLQPDDLRTELANDLVEVYFQICHSRMPLISPINFRARLKAYLRPGPVPEATLGPLHPALLATVIAWGAKFSEHPLLVHDRETNSGRSRLCRILTKRAREIAESEKIHRLPTYDNVVIALLLEPLQSHNPSDPDGFRGFWLNCGIRHLFELGMNTRFRLRELDDETRLKMTYAWWMACLADAYAAVYWRRKPVIEDEDYDVSYTDDLPIFPPAASFSTQEIARSWIASLKMAELARALARNLSRPDVSNQGMPVKILREAMFSLQRWKDEFLQLVGVPNNFQADWDFIAAVSACTCDAQYHVMWVILQSALEEFKIREVRTGEISPSEIQDLERQVFEEALNGALRIAGLTSVLTSNGYLRLDPNVLHFSTYAAGMFLARNGKPEVKTCIKGLEQYSMAYEEAYEQAQWMQQVYNNAVSPLSHLPHVHAQQSPHQHLHQPIISSSSSSSIGSEAVMPLGNGSDSTMPLFLGSSNGSAVHLSQTGAYLS